MGHQRRRPRILGDARGTWVMPDWLRPYEEFFVETGGNTIENLMNRDAREANVVINAPIALICCAVMAQVQLLDGDAQGRRPAAGQTTSAGTAAAMSLSVSPRRKT